jgi:alkylated DNA repair protein (DNA oxidative demethylase)
MIRAIDTVVGQLPRDMQGTILEHVRAVVRASPLVRPTARGGRPMRVQVTSAGRLGWAGDGSVYRYAAEDSRGNPWPPMPKLWSDIATRFAGCSYPWDSAVINWYEPEAALGWHRDQAEQDDSLPIVTISLGDSASWAVREYEGAEVTRCTLDSGAVTLLAGDARQLEHTIERIIPAPMLSPLRARGRVSVTIRVAGAVPE